MLNFVIRLFFSLLRAKQEEPAILISRLLLHMRRVYVPIIRLDFHLSRAFAGFYTSHSDRACSDHLSRETYAKHSDGAKAFGPQSLSRALTVRTAITVSDVSLTVQLFNFGFFNSFF